MRSYSFTLGPVVGPVGAYVTACGAGLSLNETWQLINRDYPTAVVKGDTPLAARKPVAVNLTPGRVACSFDMDRASLVRIELVDLEGRTIRTLFQGSLNAGTHRYSWDILEKTCGAALIRVRTGTEDRCVRIIHGAR